MKRCLGRGVSDHYSKSCPHAWEADRVDKQRRQAEAMSRTEQHLEYRCTRESALKGQPKFFGCHWCKHMRAHADVARRWLAV